MLSKKEIAHSTFHSFTCEEKIMAKIKHPNIVKLKRVIIILNGKVHESKDYLFIVMEYMAGRTLNDLIGLLNDEECSLIMKQILEALEYIHQLGMIHRDLKPQNILLSSSDNPHRSIKIADFGLGTEGICTGGENCGTLAFMAPEQLARSYYDKV